MMIIRGKTVHFDTEQVNDVYVLQHAYLADFQSKGCKMGTWIAGILCSIREVSWAITKRGISMHDLTTEARIWLNIICSRVSPCTYMTFVTELCTCMVSCLISGIALNVGQIVLEEWRHYKIQSGTLFPFPSLITELCKRVGVEEYSTYTWVKPIPHITLPKIMGEGAPEHNKKRKVDSDN